MKLLSVRTVALSVVLLIAVQMQAQNPNNPIQVALLRWYQANTTAQFATCSRPGGLAFDGSHVWVACNIAGSGGQVQEFNASDGAFVQAVSIPGAYSLAYDGANVWVSSLGTSVTKINASTGAVVGTFTVATAGVYKL